MDVIPHFTIFRFSAEIIVSVLIVEIVGHRKTQNA